jgi:L-asparagine transporter-like permease
MADLRRELGFWDALTIGAGTMIGAGIFLLAGVALELTGPAAIFSYLVAGIICIITASSAAELATGMPTYLRRRLFFRLPFIRTSLWGYFRSRDLAQPHFRHLFLPVQPG